MGAFSGQLVAVAWFAAGNLSAAGSLDLMWLGLRHRRFGVAWAGRVAAAGGLTLPIGAAAAGLGGLDVWRELAAAGAVPVGPPNPPEVSAEAFAAAAVAYAAGLAILGAAANAALTAELAGDREDRP